MLHIDELGIADGVVVKFGYYGQVAHILSALEQLLDTLFNVPLISRRYNKKYISLVDSVLLPKESIKYFTPRWILSIVR